MMMRFNALLASTSLVSALASLTLAPAQAQTAAALTGQVSSAEEATMEGLLVSAKKEGSTVTTTVVSNDKGQYSFPAGRLEPGHYNITIRAAGYTLAGPKTVDIPAGSPATADIKLEKVANQVPQLSSAECSSAPRATTRSSRSCRTASAATPCSASSPRRMTRRSSRPSSPGWAAMRPRPCQRTCS